MANFSERLKQLRQEAGLTQQQLADKIWMTKASICYYEQGDRIPSPDVLVKLAKVFHVSTDHLLGIEEKTRYLDVSGISDSDLLTLKRIVELMKADNAD
ncbi:MAG: helix-turn-helix domain-containing protein [Oscillospiraceae bacterium]